MLKPDTLHRTILALLILLAFCFKTYSQDQIPPQARCRPGLVVVMPATGSITVQATEFDDGSTDNVTAPEDLKFYFNNDPLLTEYTINCDSFETRGVFDELVVELTFMIQDEALNRSACHVMLVVQDNKAICGAPALECYGCVKEWRSGRLVEAMVNCQEDTNWCYSVVLDEPKAVSFCRNWDPLNGVTTGDIVKIQRHLLGLDDFDEQMEYVAADVNNNASITAADISSLRKLILGVVEDFSTWGLDSWIIRTTPDPITGVWYDTLFFTSLDTCPGVVDFVGVKVGDLTGDVGLNKNLPRTMIPLRAVNRNAESIVLSINEVSGLSAFEMELSLSENVDLVSIASSAINLRSHNYHQKGHRVMFSWNTEDGEAIGSTVETIDIVLHFNAPVDVNDLTVEKGGVFDIQGNQNAGLYLEKRSDHPNTLVIFPNPVSANQVFHINYPAKGAAHCQLTALNGQRVSAAIRHIPGVGFEVQGKDLVSGIYWVSISDQGRTTVEKLIVH